jgi:WD40 repeat protein
VGHSSKPCQEAPTGIMLKTPVRILKSHEGAVHVVRYNVSGQYFLSGGQDREIHLFNPNTGSKIKSYVAHGRALIVVQHQKLTSLLQAGRSLI